MAGPSPHTAVPPEPQIMHGGLFSEDGVTLDDIRKIERSRQPPDSGDRVAGDSLTFLSCMLDPCTSLMGRCWPGSRSVCSRHLFNSLQGPPGQSSGSDSMLPLQRARFHPWSGNYNPVCCEVQPGKKNKLKKKYSFQLWGSYRLNGVSRGGWRGGPWWPRTPPQVPCDLRGGWHPRPAPDAHLSPLQVPCATCSGPTRSRRSVCLGLWLAGAGCGQGGQGRG